MRRPSLPVPSGLLAALLMMNPALAEPLPPGDAENGRKLFRACAFCHTLTPDGGKRAGPTLWRLFGREAGSVAGYHYSEALKGSGIVWTEETVARLFELGPETFTPGSKMPLQRLPDPQQRADLIAYLKEAQKEATKR